MAIKYLILTGAFFALVALISVLHEFRSSISFWSEAIESLPAIVALKRWQAGSVSVLMRHFVPRSYRPPESSSGSLQDDKFGLIKCETCVLAKDEPVKIDPLFFEKKRIKSSPTRIIIPSTRIDLPIVEAKIINGSWELSQESASFGLGSALPGETGNTVIFAHAKKNLFGPLKEIKIGERIYLLAANGWFVYKVEEITDILPSQVEVIKPSQEAILTLFTCSGFADSHRLIVTAKPLVLDKSLNL